MINVLVEMVKSLLEKTPNAKYLAFFCNDRAKKNKSLNGDSIEYGTIG